MLKIWNFAQTKIDFIYMYRYTYSTDGFGLHLPSRVDYTRTRVCFLLPLPKVTCGDQIGFRPPFPLLRKLSETQVVYVILISVTLSDFAFH